MWHVWETGEVHTGFWWGNEGKRPLGRPRRRWQDNAKMDLQEVSWEGTDLTQDRYRWLALCKRGDEPSGTVKCREFD
jgi:hypothetical protein